MENLPSLPLENLILFDWLTFTVKTDDPAAVKAMIGLSDVNWMKCDKGLNGYPEREIFGNISILYGASPEMGVCCNMSGQGCRSFESFSTIGWWDLIPMIRNADDIKVTRFDAAFDDHTGILDINRLAQDVRDRLYVSKSRKSCITESDDQNTDIRGISMEIGSRSSDMLIRIYDKAAERGYTDGSHWIRIEMQMRGNIANGFISGMDPKEFGSYFRGVLHNYLRFVEPAQDDNRSRWPTTEYWAQLLDGVDKIRCWSSPGVEYNASMLTRYVVKQAGYSIMAYVKLYSWYHLYADLKSKEDTLPEKYRKLLKECGKDGTNADHQRTD